MKRCIVCESELTGKQRSYCSASCRQTSYLCRKEEIVTLVRGKIDQLRDRVDSLSKPEIRVELYEIEARLYALSRKK